MAVFYTSGVPRPHHTVLSIASQDYQEGDYVQGVAGTTEPGRCLLLSVYIYASSFSVEPWTVNSARTNVLSRDGWT